MNHVAIVTAAIVGLLIFSVCMWVGWMHGLDFSARGKDTGFTAVVSVLFGVVGGAFIYLKFDNYER